MPKTIHVCQLRVIHFPILKDYSCNFIYQHSFKSVEIQLLSIINLAIVNDTVCVEIQLLSIINLAIVNDTV